MQEKFEDLINAWIRLSMSLRNDKITKSLTFNEAILCNMIYNYEKNHQQPIQIKELCRIANMSKPLMNRSLNSLESQGFIERKKDKSDMRNVYISMKSERVACYKLEHENSLRVARNISDLIGEDINKIIEIFNKIADSIDKVL